MKHRRIILTVAALLALLIAWSCLRPKAAGAGKDPPPVAVDVATVEPADVPVYLEGLGTVQAYYTVTVTARVDGQVQKVAFIEGEDVKKGALLAQIDPRPFQAALGVAIATRDKDRAQLANAHLDMDRYQLLAPEDLASKQTVDTQKALIAQLGAQIKGDEAAIDNARTQLDYTAIRSPIDGRTGIRQIDPGNNVHASDSTGIVVVTQIEPISVIFSLPEDVFGQLNAALQRGPAAVVALSRDGREELDRGTVALIDNQIDQTTGTVRVKATLPNTQRHLWPGQFVNMRVLTQVEQQVLTIPASAVERGPEGLFTYQVQADSTVQPVALTTGNENEGRVVIEKGLKAGDRVVSSNQYRLQPGSRIKANPAPAAGAAAKAPRRGAVNVSRPFIERPVATTLLMAGVFLVGLAAFPFLPVAPLPQIDFPTILVSASLPGASPEIMASSVAQPLETQFAQISGVTQMTSTSVLGSTQVTLQFNLDRNIDAAAQDVQAAIDAAGGQLPKNLPSPPAYRKVNPADAAVLILAVHSDVLPVTQVDDYAETVIAQQLSQLPGIAQVTVGGQQKPAVRVQIDPVKLAAVGLQLEDVAGLITTASVDSPQGAITGPTKNFTIYDNDQLLKAAPWNDVIIAYRNGAPIRIRDVGVAVDGPENSQVRGFQNGKTGILLLVYKQPGTNVIDAVKGVKATLPRVLNSVPPSLKIDQVIDRTTTISASVRDVEFSLMLAIVLVVLVIFLFLRSFWATAIPGVTVPLALLGTAALMYVVGYSLDNLSLMALTIAVGFVVDDAIVMLENIYRHVEAGHEPVRGRAEGLGRDRLHDPLHQHLAGGGVHPALADERHRGSAVPRVRGHRDDDDRSLGGGRAHALPDDVCAVPA